MGIHLHLPPDIQHTRTTMKLLAAALLALSIRSSQGLSPSDTVPEYSSEECDTWLEEAYSYDADGSGGLSRKNSTATSKAADWSAATSSKIWRGR